MILRFGLIAGTGWLIDFCLFIALNWLGMPVWMANMLSASVAVLFVFFASVRRVFEYEGGYLFNKLIAYAIYQVIAIALASALIDMLARWFDIAPVGAKVIVTPITFYANFQFMSWITTGRFRLT